MRWRRKRIEPTKVLSESSWDAMSPAIGWFADQVSIADLPPHVLEETDGRNITRAFWNHTPDRHWLLFVEADA